MIAIARRYNDLLTPEPGLMPPTPDYAVARLSEELKDPQDRAVLRLLVSSMGLLPTGTVVHLNTGETAEVVRGPKGPGEKPVVKLVADERGAPIAQQPEIDLAQDLRRQVARVVSVDGWRKGLDQGPSGAPGEGEYDPDADAPGHDVQLSEPPPRPMAAVPPPASMAAAPPPISPLQPVVPASSPPRSRADQYAENFAAWGNIQEPAPESASELPPARNDSVSSSIQSGEHNSSASLPSMGSSPSAVAEAMGRMINDSLRPPQVTGERAVASPGAERVTNRPRSLSREPTAKGNLAATPLPHVLVYMLDHALTGSVIFEDGQDAPDTIYFVSGVPSKIRLRDPVGLLGEMLQQGGFLEAKAIDQAVEGSRRLGILLGEYLVGHDLATREAVSWALEAQVLHKIAHIANLPPELAYSYYRDIDALEGWGGGDVTMSAPLNPILASVRNWMDRARVRATLNRIGKHMLVVHDDSDLSNLALLPEEQATLDLIRGETLSLPQLFKRNIADEEVVSSLIYALAVTRQFAFKGQKKGPMAARGMLRGVPSQPPDKSRAPSTEQQPSKTQSSKPQPPVSGAIPSGAPTPSSSQSKPIGGNTPATPSKQVAAVAAGGAPARPHTPAHSPEIAARAAQVGAAGPVSARKAPAPGGPPSAAAPAPRAMAPAARPQGAPMSTGTLPRASPPRIQKKGTVVGLQPAAPPDARLASKPPETVPPAKAPSIAPSDDNARTIMMTKTPMFGAKGGPGSARPSRPPPALPSKLAAPKPAPTPAKSGGPPSARAGAQKQEPRAEKPTTKINGADIGDDDIDIDLDDGSS
jgi:hypothetical protein